LSADPVRRIADAVLYEGYLLWPYRKSALKNQQRFTFGGVYPPAWEDRSAMQAQVLLEGPADAEIEVRVRFLHVVQRQVLRIPARSAPAADAAAELAHQHPAEAVCLRHAEPVEELVAGGERWVSWDEAVERELAPGPIRVPAGETVEALPGGAIRRSWAALEGDVSLQREVMRSGLSLVTVRIVNTSPWAGGSRADALRQTLCSTHAVLRARGGEWVSPTDPPRRLRAEIAACENVGVWPVLVGAEGDRCTMLAAPIILGDYPAIAPESPGDLFDSGEIDQMLVLNILAMTDDERREMRDSDPRAREILQRTEALSGEEIMRLNGAVREFGLVRAR
jgi:hydrogenase maturation protease